MISNWEASGNGLGQRSSTDADFGCYTEEHGYEDGDNRSNFVRTSMGHRSHHLYLWKIADEMGVLSNVLNILSPEVGADGDKVRTDTARSSNKKRARAEEEEKAEAKAFRAAIGKSLSDLAATNEVIAAATSKKVSNEHLAGLVMARGVEEDKMVKYQVAAMSSDNGEVRKFYAELVSVHSDRIESLTEEIKKLKSADETVLEHSDSEG